jgi:hypothetical protein
MKEDKTPPLWSEDRVEAYLIASEAMRAEGKDAQVAAERHEGTPHFRMVISGKHSPELSRRVALQFEQ